MPTTAWRFSSTEGADAAVLMLKQWDAQDMIDVHDVTVLRWPLYAAEPLMHEHATDEGSKISARLAHRIRRDAIDSSMIEAVKGDMTPGTSVVVLLSTDAVIDKIAASRPTGQDMQLIRSDLSVQQQDQLRIALGESTPQGDQPPAGA